jgi:hypothetical protein
MQPYSITVVQVKPGMALEWESYLEQTAIPLMKKAGIKEIGVSRTYVLGVDSTHYLMTPVVSLAEFDGIPPMYKAMGGIPCPSRCPSCNGAFPVAGPSCSWHGPI